MSAQARRQIPSAGVDDVRLHIPGLRGPAETRFSPLFSSPAMLRVREVVESVAGTAASVIVSGETGVGKEIVARLLHDRSPRRDRPFVKVNCAALPLELLESEMFGYERGAFTGAERTKPGKFELAHEGTLFLDEIGELPLPLQAKLLHALQDHEFVRLGGKQVIHVDVRIVAASNRRLPDLVRAGAFREDLYYRLNVIPIEVPPLRERREAIPELAMRVMERACLEYGRPPVPLSPEVVDQLTAYSWPGNVRELENLVRRIVVFGAAEPFAGTLGRGLADPVIDSSEATAIQTRETTDTPEVGPSGGPVEVRGLQDIVRRTALAAEAHALMETLNKVRWNRGVAARVLGISYKTLNRKMKQHGLRKTLLRTPAGAVSLLTA